VATLVTVAFLTSLGWGMLKEYKCCRDFPDVEFRMLDQHEVLRFADGTGLNIHIPSPGLDVLSARGKKASHSERA
jgi:hypothetical protein